MTHAEALALVGSGAYYHAKGMKVEVRICEVRSAFGRIDALITPLAGSGQAWVDVTTLELKEPPKTA